MIDCRLVGVQKAVEMILRSAPVKAAEAKELELLDEVVPRDQLIATAGKKALELAGQDPKTWKRTLQLEDKVDKESSLQVVSFHSFFQYNHSDKVILHFHIFFLDKYLIEF